MRGKVLIIDDEQNILDLVSYNLQAVGFSTITALSGNEALGKVRNKKPDLIILDVMLPEIDGFELLRIIRKETTTPIIMLTAKKEEIDTVLGLEMGADDYITKPFSSRELTARVKAVYRRLIEKNSSPDEEVLTSGTLKMNTIKHQFFNNEQEVELTSKEFELLKLFMTNPGKVFTRENLIQSLWNYDYYGDTKTIDVHIRHLRQKIEEDSSNPKFIKTVRGVGYKFQE